MPFVNALLYHVASRACEGVDCERVSIFVYEKDRELVRCLVSDDIKDEVMPASLGIIGAVMRESADSRIIICADMQNDERHYNGFDGTGDFISHNCMTLSILTHGRSNLPAAIQVRKRSHSLKNISQFLV